LTRQSLNINEAKRRQETLAKKNTVEIILAAKDQASKVTRQAFSSIQNTANSAMSTIKTSATVASAAVMAVSAAVGKMGIDFNAGMEQSQIAWETLLGSADEAKKTIDDLLKLGAQTPFEFEGLDKSAKLLNMAGFEGDKLKNTLVAVGDAVSAVGGGQEELQGVSMALFQMSAKGKVSAEEMNQLAERGIPAWDLIAKKMGKSTRELMDMSQNGELFADKVIPMLVEGMGDRFGGAMEKQSKTYKGLMSTIWDNTKMLTGELTKNAFNTIKGHLENIIPLMDGALQLAKGDVIGFSETVTKAFGQETGLSIMKFVFAVQDGMEKVKTAFNNVKGFAKGIFEAFKGNEGGASSILHRLGFSPEAIQLIIDKTKIIKEAISVFIAESIVRFEMLKTGIKNVIDWLTPYVIPAIEAVVSFVGELLAQLTAFWKENGTQIMEAVQNAFSMIKSIIEFVMPLVLLIIQSVWGSIKGAIEGTLNVIMGLIKIFAGIFTGDFSKMWEGVKQLFLGAVVAVWNIFNLLFVGKIISGLKALGKGMLTNVQYYWQVVKDGFTKLAVSAKDKAVGMVQGVLQWFGNLLVQARTIFSMLRQYGEGIFRALWNTLRSIASNIFGSVRGYFSNLGSSARSIFSSLWSNVTSIFNRIKNSITSPIIRAKNTVLDMVQRIKNAFNFSWKLPKFKLPHISVSTKKGALGIPYPDFDVDWYDKGGVFYGPQIIGVGEKRPEFVGALDDLRKIVREETRMPNNAGSKESRQPLIVQLVTPDSRIFSEWLVDDLTNLQKFNTNRISLFEKGG
jgi:tape measure domain-containing protein